MSETPLKARSTRSFVVFHLTRHVPDFRRPRPDHPSTLETYVEQEL
jgi:hypothetical protein